MMSGWTTLCRVCRLSTQKKKNPRNTLAVVSLIANVGFHHILKWRPPFTKTEPYRWGLNLKFLYSSPVSPCLPDPLPSAAANQTWQRFEETLEREFIDGGGRKEGGVFKRRENVFSFFFFLFFC